MVMRTLVVFQKELKDAMRDRRSLVSIAMYALWAPLAVALALGAVARDRADDGEVAVHVEGAAQAPSLVHHLTQHGLLVVATGASAADAIGSGAVEVALVVPPDHAERFAGARPAAVHLLYDGASSRGTARAARVRRVLAGYGQQVAATRLVLRGIGPDIATPLVIHDRDLSTAAARAGRLLAMLPVFFLLAPFVGGMALAVDATAGERERGSLEALLLNPTPAWVVVAGKWMAAVVFAGGTAAVMALVTSVALDLPRVRALDLPIGLPAADVAAVLLVLLPLALLAPALQMLLSLFAASAREAHTQVSLLTLIAAVPGFFVAFGSVPEGGWLTMVPLVAQQVQIGDLLSGRAVGAEVALVAAAVSLAAAGVALAATTRLLVRERIARTLP